jgi:hypothetical protein
VFAQDVSIMTNRLFLLLGLSIFLANFSAARAACNVDIAKPWGKTGIVVEAFSHGPDCEKAVVALVLRDGHGKVLFNYMSQAGVVGSFTTLAPALVKTPAQMHTALLNWAGVAVGSKLDVMSGFPPWKKGAMAPAETPPSEFPFTANEEISRDDYLKWQGQKRPVFCFVQGIESQKCLVLTDENAIIDIGIQSFPG